MLAQETCTLSERSYTIPPSPLLQPRPPRNYLCTDGCTFWLQLFGLNLVLVQNTRVNFLHKEREVAGSLWSLVVHATVVECRTTPRSRTIPISWSTMQDNENCVYHRCKHSSGQVLIPSISGTCYRRVHPQN